MIETKDFVYVVSLRTKLPQGEYDFDVCHPVYKKYEDAVEASIKILDKLVEVAQQRIADKIDYEIGRAKCYGLCGDSSITEKFRIGLKEDHKLSKSDADFFEKLMYDYCITITKCEVV